MSHKEIKEKYGHSFEVSVPGFHYITDEEWVFDDEYASPNSIKFRGYDANMCAMPDWTEFDPTNEFDVERVLTCKRITKGFEGKVYMDDVCISDIDLKA